MIGIIWLAILYIKNQRGSLLKNSKQSTIEVGLVNETTSDSSPPSTIQRESETLKRHLMQPSTQIYPEHSQQVSPNSQSPNSQNGTPVYWSASQLLDNNNLVLQSRGVNATLDPISEEIDDMEDSNDSISDRGKFKNSFSRSQTTSIADKNILEDSYKLVKHFLDFLLWEYTIASFNQKLLIKGSNSLLLEREIWGLFY